jgi:hypothetical protein
VRGRGGAGRGGELEATDLQHALAAYQGAAEHFKRFHAMLPSLKEAMNDLGIAYAKLGVLAMNRTDTPRSTPKRIRVGPGPRPRRPPRRSCEAPRRPCRSSRRTYA